MDPEDVIAISAAVNDVRRRHDIGQSQRSLSDQLRAAHSLLNAAGLYDAADFVKGAAL